MKPEEVAKKCKVKVRIVQRWASQNGVPFTGEGRRKDYHFSPKDVERFLNRRGPGRPREEDE
jgi:DNA-binding transcriptional MerR regulator